MSEYQEVNPELEALAANAEDQPVTESETEQQGEQLTDHEHEQAAEALAGTMVAGLEKMLQLRYPHFEMDADRGRDGVEALKPVAADFVGDMPDWLKPYAKYLGAGLFIGGCVFEAKRQEKILQQEQEVKNRGNQSEHGMAEPA